MKRLHAILKDADLEDDRQEHPEALESDLDINLGPQAVHPRRGARAIERRYRTVFPGAPGSRRGRAGATRFGRVPPRRRQIARPRRGTIFTRGRAGERLFFPSIQESALIRPPSRARSLRAQVEKYLKSGAPAGRKRYATDSPRHAPIPPRRAVARAPDASGPDSTSDRTDESRASAAKKRKNRPDDGCIARASSRNDVQSLSLPRRRRRAVRTPPPPRLIASLTDPGVPSFHSFLHPTAALLPRSPRRARRARARTRRARTARRRAAARARM